MPADKSEVSGKFCSCCRVYTQFLNVLSFPDLHVNFSNGLNEVVYYTAVQAVTVGDQSSHTFPVLWKLTVTVSSMLYLLHALLFHTIT